MRRRDECKGAFCPAAVDENKLGSICPFLLAIWPSDDEE